MARAPRRESRDSRAQTFFTQGRINWLNFFVAATAAVLAIPSGINQYNQFFRDKEQYQRTTVVYYSPREVSLFDTSLGSQCWGSRVSKRSDAYKCTAGNEISDPCFWSDQYTDDSYSYFYCPASWEREKDSEGKWLLVNENKVERRHPTPQIEADEDQLPWLIKLMDNTECRLVSGAVGIAYGDKGNIYGCDGERYVSVTDGNIEGSKHFFECKLAEESVYRKCLASLVVY